MKVTLDIDQLLNDGRISQDEYNRLKQFASESTTSLALNIVLAFGIVAVAGGTIALFQSATATMCLGLFVGIVGGYICAANLNKWLLLGRILLPLGALTGAGGIIAATDGHVEGFAITACLFVVGAVAARSGLLASLSAFAMLSALGGSTGYEHAAYYLCIEKPLLTVIVFSLLAALGYFVSQRIPLAYSRLAIIFSRTAIVIVNFGFWVGSLWGDGDFNHSFHFDWFFIIGWAVLILAVGIWGVYRNLPWLVTTAATFGAIHLYTQWFEHFNATPGSVIVAGFFTIIVAYALISYNRRVKNMKANGVIAEAANKN